MNPATKFRHLTSWWFNIAAHFLRISNFILGVHLPDEESDDEGGDEDGAEIRYLTVNNPRRRSSRRATRSRVEVVEDVQSVDSDGSEWEDEDNDNGHDNLNPGNGVRKVQREFRFLRVPNHDYVQVIKGIQMNVPIKEHDEIFGHSHETPEQVARNWTKVYAPDHFNYRVFLFFYL
jgi:hypothetical protein